MISEAKARLREQAASVSWSDGAKDLRALLDDHDRLESENAALRAELIAVLRESVDRGSSDDGDGRLYGQLWCRGMMLRLIELGEMSLVSDDGRRVVARWRQ